MPDLRRDAGLRVHYHPDMEAPGQRLVVASKCSSPAGRGGTWRPALHRLRVSRHIPPWVRTITGSPAGVTGLRAGVDCLSMPSRIACATEPTSKISRTAERHREESLDYGVSLLEYGQRRALLSEAVFSPSLRSA